MTQATFQDLVDQLQPYLEQQDTGIRPPLSTDTQLALALLNLAMPASLYQLQLRKTCGALSHYTPAKVSLVILLQALEMMTIFVQRKSINTERLFQLPLKLVEVKDVWSVPFHNVTTRPNCSPN
ncbi:hypothetical protein Y1Q_0014407 [Alligator mississippiensis]|uniref:Uncharacterized protein n=1 Tax=Alligator mississippiensis TaxID=8496 RepID=A0A151PCM2_ALLMI|nr:hypothetical protein Y1Q_0014407 [Alligator mississippiensis]